MEIVGFLRVELLVLRDKPLELTIRHRRDILVRVLEIVRKHLLVIRVRLSLNTVVGLSCKRGHALHQWMIEDLIDARTVLWVKLQNSDYQVFYFRIHIFLK